MSCFACRPRHRVRAGPPSHTSPSAGTPAANARRCRARSRHARRLHRYAPRPLRAPHRRPRRPPTPFRSTTWNRTKPACGPRLPQAMHRRSGVRAAPARFAGRAARPVVPPPTPPASLRRQCLMRRDAAVQTPRQRRVGTALAPTVSAWQRPSRHLLFFGSAVANLSSSRHLGLGLDVDLPPGQPVGETRVLPVLADGKRAAGRRAPPPSLRSSRRRGSPLSPGPATATWPRSAPARRCRG